MATQHHITTAQGDHLKRILALKDALHKEILQMKDSRARALADIKLEESIMWAQRGILQPVPEPEKPKEGPGNG